MVAPGPAGADQLEVPLSAVIEAVLNEAERRPIRVRDLLEQTADRGYGLLLTVLGLPMLIPFLPPGSSTVVGPIYAAFAVQMLRGARHPWVPHRFQDWVIARSTVKTLRERGLPIIRTFERFSRPRGVWVSERIMLRAVGVMVFLMGLVLLSPLPGLNTLPAVSVMLIGIGLLNRDAVFVLAGLGVGLFSLGLIGLSARAILILIERLRGAMP
jgi:hypothetical protein